MACFDGMVIDLCSGVREMVGERQELYRRLKGGILALDILYLD